MGVIAELKGTPILVLRSRHQTGSQIVLESRIEGGNMPSIERGGVRIHYEDVGTGLPIVMGHSFLCSGEMWGPQIGPLSSRYRVVNIDVRGHGRSGALSERFDLYDMVDDVVAVLDEAGVQRAAWAGLSIGGMIAMRAAIKVPDRVAGLILVDTHAGPETSYKKLKYRVMALGVRAFGVGPFLSEVTKLMFGSTTRKENPQLVEAWRERFASVNVPSILLTLGALVGRDSVVDQLGSVDVPSLVIVGDEDISLPTDLSREIANALPNASLEIISGAGHLSALEKPDEVTQAMLAFLDSLE
jgi:pimeloyl-ACP methyl ester carboxylesterase